MNLMEITKGYEPEHSYPLGTVMTVARRQELLEWCARKMERYIIEDDYDCEFRYNSRMVPTLYSMDTQHRVIYMNTFSKTLAPSLRISYMILPEKLMRRYLESATFYSNTASACEQYALAKFIDRKLHIEFLSEFCAEAEERYQHIMILNYSELNEEILREAIGRLDAIFRYLKSQSEM